MEGFESPVHQTKEKMMRISKTKLFSAIALISFLTISIIISKNVEPLRAEEPTTLPSGENTSVKPLDVSNRYPLPPLSKEERIEKINTFIKPYAFNLYRGTAVKREYSKQEEKECTAAVHQLRNISTEDILEPSYVAHSGAQKWVR